MCYLLRKKLYLENDKNKIPSFWREIIHELQKY